MSNEPLIVTHAPEVAVLAPEQIVQVEQHLVQPSADQVRLTDEVFAQSSESEMVAGLLGMHAGILLLHDLAREKIAPEAPAMEPRRRRPGLPGTNPEP